MSSPADDTMTLLVQGNQSHHVVKLDDKRQPLVYGPVEMPPDAPPMLLLADTAGSWIVSHGRGGTDMQRLWRARVD